MTAFVPVRDFNTGRWGASWPRCGPQPTDRQIKEYEATLNGLNGDGTIAITAASATAASLTSGGAAASALIAAGVSAQAIPVIGTVLGAIALIGGFMLQQKAKAKAIKGQVNDINNQNIELIKQSSELDNQINISRGKLLEVDQQINKLGLNGFNGLSGFGTWLKKTFAPAAYQKDILADRTKQNEVLTALVEQKIGVLESFESELQRLYAMLTKSKTEQKIILGVGIGATMIGLFLLLNSNYKWIKF